MAILDQNEKRFEAMQFRRYKEIPFTHDGIIVMRHPELSIKIEGIISVSFLPLS